MTAQMVNWPVNGHEWVDTGDGGMYAVLVVLQDEELDDPRCHIGTDIVMTRQHAPVSAVQGLWGPYNAASVRSRAEAEQILRTARNEDAYRWAVRAYSPEALSASVQVAIHLGSTHETLNRPGHGMFQVRYKDLTDNGKTIYYLLGEAHGREPKILTFLDT